MHAWSVRLALSCTLALGAALTADRSDTARPAYFPADADRGRALALVCHGVAEMPAGTQPSFAVPRLAGQRGEAILAALEDYRSGTRRSPIIGPLVASLTLQDMRDLATRPLVQALA